MSEKSTSSARLERGSDGRLSVIGRLDAVGVARIWKEVFDSNNDKATEWDASGVDYCDGAGLALIYALNSKEGVSVKGLSPDIEKLLESFKNTSLDVEHDGPKKRESAAITLGKIGADYWADIRDIVEFMGKLAITSLACIAHPNRVRWTDMWLTVQRAGVNALLIAGLISFLTGMILAFQSSAALKTFGVEIFVVNLVALAMLREMAAIMTAVVLAGRSGSAFAAEIGTMKVNEEINALNTMGIDPVQFLVVPRMMAGLIVTPLLTIYAGILGVGGGFFVMLMEGYPLSALWKQMIGAVGLHDVLAGLIKSVFFGVLIAAVGCLRGLQTKSGASAVGESTTSAVVTSIFLIVVVDAIFAVVFYVLDF